MERGRRFVFWHSLTLRHYFSMALAALTVPGGVSRAQQLCPSEGNASGRVVSVDDRLDLTLEDGTREDGTRLKIGGIDPARPTPDNPDLDGRARENVANWLTGQTVEFRPLEPGQDRWGRVVAMVFAPAPGSLGNAKPAAFVGRRGDH